MDQSQQWRKGRITSANDTLLTSYLPSDFTDAVRAKCINVHPWPLILLRAFLTGSNNDVATLTISGWMDRKLKTGPGWGHRLWTGTVTAGAKTSAELPLQNVQWPAGTYFEADTWTATIDRVGAIEKNDADKEAYLILPTLGYQFLLVEVTGLGAGGAEADSVGLIWRPMPVQPVYALSP